VVRVMVLSPQFTYRVEQGVPVAGAAYERPGHWDMASRLSYLLWGTMPDAQLFAAAEAGKLGTRAEVGAQAKRLLEDPRAEAMVTNFAGQWLQLREVADAAKDDTLYPAWKDEFLPLFRQETEALLASVWKGDAKIDTLLSAPYTHVNGALATFYGIKGVSARASSPTPASWPGSPAPTRARPSCAASSCVSRCSVSRCPSRPSRWTPTRPSSTPP